jgi:hypothetical protein
MQPGEGEFVLTRKMGALSGRNSNVVFVTGTYFREKDSIFVNARMIRGSDGLVLRTGQLIIQNNELIDNLFARSIRRLHTGTVSIVSYEKLKNPPKPDTVALPPSTPFDRGMDIH